MALSDRRSRERAQRHELIVAAARDLAEAEGWEAVTTRRLAEIVEYSQPVLYSHFDGRDAIVRAVALQGFEALALSLREARLSAAQSEPALRKVFGAYLNFAAERPAVYQAMFVLPVDIKFASDDTPPALKAGFDELVSAVAPFGGSSELRAEVGWAALHGLAVLRRGGRIPQEREQARLDLLVDQIVAAASASP